MKLKLFEIVMDIDKLDIEKTRGILDSKESIKDWAYIRHDQDETRQHYHICCRLQDSYDTKYISAWFDVPENFISKVKGRWTDMLKYLIHENAPTKYQYNPDLVISNFDWISEKDRGNRQEEIINKIVDGTIREYNYHTYITALENDKYYKSIANAFKYRADMIKGVDRQMDCIFITGDSGSGKTTYAKKIANEKDMSVYVSSGSNDILDDYKGQACIVLDDLRPSSLGLADLLKMLDNNTSSTVKSRYKNKVLECKLIIITTVLDIDTFFKNVFTEDIETCIQLKRRCETHIEMTSEYLYVKTWLKKSKEYGKEYKSLNPIFNTFVSDDLNEDEQITKLTSILGDFEIIEDEDDKYEWLKVI